ncbi:gyghO [Escherichia coli H489]|nr:gyghO [Escherichia coli H489]
MAKKAGQIVGRITAQIDTLHRERYGKDTGHFGMIDALMIRRFLPRCLAQRKRG